MPIRALRIIAAAVAALSITPARAENKPSVVDVLFEHPHISNLKEGTELKYRFQRTVSDAKLAGEPFSDDITLRVGKANGDGRRDVVVQIFSGERARDPQNVPDMTGNPLLVFYLDRAVRTLGFLSGGNPMYLKQKFRAALGNGAVIEPTKVEYGGKVIDGYRITVTPYAKDENAAKMQGYSGSRFVIIASDEAPGEFVDFISTFESTVQGAPRLEERITLVGMGESK